MPVKISPTQIENLQQIEAVVAGPDDANRLFIIDGQFDHAIIAGVYQKQNFTVLVGPVLARKQFVQAIATASVTKTQLDIHTAPAGMTWEILSVDADWDDESGQVELRIEVGTSSSGQENRIQIYGFGFHVTILAAGNSSIKQLPQLQ